MTLIPISELRIPQVFKYNSPQCNLPPDLTDGISDDFEVNVNRRAFVIDKLNVIICDSKLSGG